MQGELLFQRCAREHRPRGHGDRTRREAKDRCGLDRVPRRRHSRRGCDVRVAQHRVALAASVLFVVENNHYAQSTPVELELAGSIAARGLRSVSRSASSTRPMSRPSTRRPDVQSAGSVRRARRSSSCSTYRSARTRSPTTSAIRRDRGAAYARSAARRRRPSRGRRALRDRGALRGACRDGRSSRRCAGGNSGSGGEHGLTVEAGRAGAERDAARHLCLP